MSPELKPFFKDRASSLDAIYRTLAVTDYTWAHRFPEPPCSPVDARRKMLEARDGLFQTESGVAAPWLVALLGAHTAGQSAEQALDQASSKPKLTGAAYERRRAQIRRLTLALGSDKAIGAARARLYCARAEAFDELAAHHRRTDGATILAGRSEAARATEESVFIVVSGARRSAATLLQTEGGPVLVTDAAIAAGDDHPRLFAYSADGKGLEMSAAVLRRDADLGLAILASSGTESRTGLVLADEAAAKDDLIVAIGHVEVSGPWTKTSGLVTKISSASFQTDAVVAVDYSGGPALNESGEVAGILVARPADTEEGRWPVAVPAAAIARWLETGETTPVSAFEIIEDAGTAAVLSRTRPSALTETGFNPEDLQRLPPPPPTPHGVCMARCEDPSPPRVRYAPRRAQSTRSSGPSFSAADAAMAQAVGELGAELILKGISGLFRGIGKLFKKREKPAAYAFVDNRRNTGPAAVQEPPRPAPDPLKPASLTLAVSRSVLAQGEELEAVATVTFTGKEGSIAGRTVTFSAAPAGKLTCRGAKTDSSGVARTTCTAFEDRRERRFDALENEAKRRSGLKVPGRVRRKVVKGDKVAELQEKAEDGLAALDDEESKYPEIGNRPSDTPGLYKPYPEPEVIEFEIKGDRVTFGVSLEKLIESIKVDILEQPCPEDSIAAQSSKPNRYRCGSKSKDNASPNNFSKTGEETPGSNEGEAPADDDDELKPEDDTALDDTVEERKLRGRDSKRDHDRKGKLADDEFREWYHKEWKKPGDPDANDQQVEEAHQEWIHRGRPRSK